MKSLLLSSAFMATALSGYAVEQTYDGGFEPTPPSPFPVAYKDYQILPNTMSPDRRFAFIYPKRSRLYELSEYGLYLAALNPFRILSKIPTGHSNLAANAHGYYAANWAKDSSATVFIAGRKWGPNKVWVLQLSDGRVAKRSDLTEAVRQELLPDFKKSRAARYNEYYDFIFDSEDRQTVVNSETLAERGWDLDNRGQVTIDCTCTTDPKELRSNRWAVRFKGTWDIASAKFLHKEFTRMPPRPNQAMPFRQVEGPELAEGQRTPTRCATTLFMLKPLPLRSALAHASRR
jgi:hypothetical protein